jgi:hypothetical protein
MSAELIAEFKRTIMEGLTSKTLSSCSRWAAHRRIMGEPFPGPYTWKYHPWVREMHDSQAGFNTAMKSAQAGVTEVGINRAFYVIDQLKRDVLYVLPTSIVASDFSKARFSVALKHSPYLASVFTDTNTVNLKQAGTCNLYIRGSRGDSNLVSIPVSEMILDEVDRMDQKQIWLALERLSGQTRKCVWAISTPTIPNYGIHKLYKNSTQEHFVFECPACSRWTELIWPDCVEIIGETIYDPRCHESFLKCKECKNRLEHKDKPNWLGKTGRWEVFAKNANPDHRGFHINQLYSFTVSPGELVVAYLRGMGDEAANKEFHNSKLGLPFIGEGAQITDDMIDDGCIGTYTSNGDRPRVGGQRLITLGVDQGKYSYWVVCEWFVDQLANDINIAARCKVLAFGKFHEDDWHVLRELMREWQVLACVIDADPQINEARRFAKEFPGYAYLCRYRRGKTAKEISISEADSGAPIATVDRTNWLTASLGRFRTKRIVLPRDISLEFREHIKALVRTYEPDETGNPVATFVETGPDHYAHALNYAEIALPLAASITTGKNVEKFL